MGTENLGYKGMFPLGQSYAMGQWALHADVAPDPGDPSIPEPAYFDGFWEAAQGSTMDRSTWSSADFANFHAQALANIGAVRALFAAYVANGPLPVDAETNSPGSLWKSEDGITSERHIYYYDNQSSYGGGIGARGLEVGLGSDAAKYVQIQGFTVNVGTPAGSQSPGAWVLPRDFSSGGQQIFGWRYDADHSGPPYDNTKWKGVFNFGQWATASEGEIVTWFVVAWGALFSIMTAGVASAAVAAAALAVGIALSAVEVAGVVLVIDSLVIGVVKYAMTGDSSALMGALQAAVSELSSLSPAALKAFETNYPDAAQFVKNVASSVTNVWNDAKAAIGAGESEVSALVSSAQKMATTFPTIDGDFWNLAKQAIGPSNLPGSYFMNLARLAPSLDVLKNLEGAVPWYAQGFLQFGATIRAAEIGQYLHMTGGGTIAMPIALVKPTPLQLAAQVHAMPFPKLTPLQIASRAHINPLLPPVGKTKSPDEIIAEQKGKGGIATVAIGGGILFALAKVFGLL